MSLSLTLGFSISCHQRHRELVRQNDSRLSRLFEHTVMTPSRPSHCQMGITVREEIAHLWHVKKPTAEKPMGSNGAITPF